MLWEKKDLCVLVRDFSLIFSCSRAKRFVLNCWQTSCRCLRLIIILSIIHSLDAKAKEHRGVSSTVDQRCRCSHSSRKVKQWSPPENALPGSPSTEERAFWLAESWALCTDGRWFKRNPVLNSEAQNVSFYVTRTDTLVPHLPWHKQHDDFKYCR